MRLTERVRPSPVASFKPRWRWPPAEPARLKHRFHTIPSGRESRIPWACCGVSHGIAGMPGRRTGARGAKIPGSR